MTIQDDKSQHRALRPPPPRRSFSVRHIVLLFAGLLAMWGVWQIIWIATGKPAPVIDYIPRINALVEQYQPEGENGWPILVEALKRADEANLAAINEFEEPLGPVLELEFFALYEPNIVRDFADYPGVLDTALERRALELYEEMGVYELLDQAAASPKMVRLLPAGGGPLYTIQLTDLMPFRALAKALVAQMHVAAQQGDDAGFVRAFEQCLAIGRATGSQALIIDRLVGQAILALAFGRAMSIAGSGELDEATLHELSAALIRHNRLPPLALQLETERMYVLDTIQHAFTDDGHGDGRLKSDGLSQTFGTAPSLGGSLGGFLLAGRRETTEKINEFLDELIHLSKMRPSDSKAALEHLDDKVENLGHRHVFARMILPALAKFVQASALMDQQIIAFDIVIAIERYRLAEGTYPAELSSLAPEYLKSVPADPLHGKPFVYRLIGEMDYVLYSTGIDLVDDSTTRDWTSVDASRQNPFRDGEDLILNLTLPHSPVE